MKDHRIRVEWLVLAVGVCWGIATEASAQRPDLASKAIPPESLSAQAIQAAATSGVPLEHLPPAVREIVGHVLEQPTLFAQGPTEIFRGNPTLYRSFLDHPDQAIEIWRRLGAKCTEITSLGNGRFRWTDGRGSEVYWETVLSEPHQRIWYAEGSARVGPLLPKFPARAVVVLRFASGCDQAGQVYIRHEADLWLQTDSRTASVVTRLLGASAPRLAEHGIAQMEMFFSALVWYLDHHPERAEALQLRALLAQE